MPSSYATIDWYDSPRYYDLIFDVETPQEADFLEGVMEEYGPRVDGRRVRRALEPACGSGRLVVELARRGWRVHGQDLSAAMLEFARERLRHAGLARRARLEVADMAAFGLREPVHLAHCGVSTFKYLLNERDARAHLECVSAALVPGGLYSLGFHLSDYADTRKSVERWRVQADGLDVRCSIEGWPPDRRTRTEDVRSRLRVVGGEREERSETRWKFRTYDARQVRRLLRSVPSLEHVATHDFTYDLDKRVELDDEYLDKVLILRKRG